MRENGKLLESISSRDSPQKHTFNYNRIRSLSRCQCSFELEFFFSIDSQDRVSFLNLLTHFLMDSNPSSFVVRSTCKPGNFNYPFIVKLDNVSVSRSKNICGILSDLEYHRI